MAGVGRAGEGGQRFAQVLEDADVVDDEAVVLVLVYSVGPGDGLHQRMGLQRLVEVERGQARHVEASQPHGADDGDAEGVLRLLEGVVEGQALQAAELGFLPQGFGQVEPFLDQAAMGRDVQAPLPESGHLALLLADDHGRLRLAHPVDLPSQVYLLLLIGCPL